MNDGGDNVADWITATTALVIAQQGQEYDVVFDGRIGGSGHGRAEASRTSLTVHG